MSTDQPAADRPTDPRVLIDTLRQAALDATSDAEARRIITQINQVTRQYKVAHGIGIPRSPVAHALDIDPQSFATRPHIDYLSDRLTEAVAQVEAGHNQMLTVSMPPRSGKSTLTSYHFPTWILRKHPTWKIGMLSHDASLVTGWGRQMRRTIEDVPSMGISLSRDHGGAGEWQTTEGGGVLARSVGGTVVGKGFKVLLMDDIVKDFVAAHSKVIRDTVWDKWRSDFFTRLEPPYLVVAIGTRWHEDDFIGRLLSSEHEGDPADWERIEFPAIAQEADVLGRVPGEPLLSPLLTETEDEALGRWADVRQAVGSYTWAALYQQKPAPSEGAIFNTEWWRYWTTDLSRETDDGRVVYLDPDTLTSGRWVDSWDFTFSASEDSDYVVGQRWVKEGADRFLIAQQRGRWSFTECLERMTEWATSDSSALSPYGRFVHEYLVEEAANGAAIIDTLKRRVSGIKPVKARVSKESRARAVSPEVESGHVYLPHPSMSGYEWVQDLLSELRNFPHDVHDDQVDALTQALLHLRDQGKGMLTVPGAAPRARTSTPGTSAPGPFAPSPPGGRVPRTAPGRRSRGGVSIPGR